MGPLGKSGYNWEGQEEEEPGPGNVSAEVDFQAKVAVCLLEGLVKATGEKALLRNVRPMPIPCMHFRL